MNSDSLRYALRRISSFRVEDVSQRLKLKVRHQWLRRKAQVSPDAFSLKRLCEMRSSWMEESATPSGIRDILAGSDAHNSGWLNIGSQDLWTAFTEEYSAHSAHVMERGRLLLDGVATIFGWMKVDIGRDPNWRSVYNRRRPAEEWLNDLYWTLDFSRLNGRQAPDVKINWEINRLQFLLDLGICFRISGANCYALKARHFLEGWLDTVSYPFGPQWASNLEVALRVLSIVRLCQFFAVSDAWDDEFLLKVVASVELHLDHLENELTLHHTRGNHLLGESASLLQVSLLCPFLKESARRIMKASGILNSLIPDLILPDGVYAEQSVSYAKFILEFLLPLCGPQFREHSGLSDSSMALILKCLKFLREISGHDATLPMIGDSDSGSALGLYLDDYWDFAPLFASGSYMFRDPDLGKIGRRFPPESFIFCGKDGLQWHQSLVDEPGGKSRQISSENPTATHFPEGGLIKAEYRGLRVLFDVGPLGKSPGFEHGHSDGLSVQLWLDDQAILIDPGTYVYNANPRWREYFKGSSAHNVLQIRGADQSRSLGSFRWAYSPEVSDVRMTRQQDHFCLSGTLRLDDAVWTRSILNIGADTIVMLDALNCLKGDPLSMNLVFDPSLRLVEYSEESVKDACFMASLLLVGWPCCSADLLYGAEDAPGGWISRLYGQLEPTFQLRAQAKADQDNYSAIIIGKNPTEMMGVSIPEDIGSDVKGQVGEQAISWFTRALANGYSNGMVKRYCILKNSSYVERTE